MSDEPPAGSQPDIFISRNRQTHGPYPRDVVAKWIDNGKIHRLDLACTNETCWQPVENLLWPEASARPAAPDDVVTQIGLTRRQLALIIAIPVLIIGVVAIIMIVLAASQKRSAARSTIQPASQIATTGNPAQDILLTLCPSDQAISLGKSVGEGCVGTYSYFMGIARDTKNAFWSVRCTNGKNYEVMISPDVSGSTKVLDCDVLQLVTKTRCFEKLRE